MDDLLASKLRTFTVSRCRRPYKNLTHENVASEVSTRQKSLKSRSLLAVNEDFEAIFNAVMSSAAVLTYLSRITPS